MKYIITSLLSVLVTALFLNFGHAATKVSDDETDELTNYTNGYFQFRNWKISVAPNHKRYQTGSDLMVSNQSNPIAVSIKDNDNGGIESFLLTGKLIGPHGHSLCDMDQVKVNFAADNHINRIALFDGDENNRKLSHIVVLKRIDGNWRISERKEANCKD